MTGIPTVAVLGVGIWLFCRQLRKDTVDDCQVIAAVGTLVVGFLMAVVIGLGVFLMVPSDEETTLESTLESSLEREIDGR